MQATANVEITLYKEILLIVATKMSNPKDLFLKNTHFTYEEPYNIFESHKGHMERLNILQILIITK